MPAANDAPVRIECVVNPDVHIGDGRILKGPIKSGTKTVTPGDVTEVSADVAALLIDNGQAQKTDKEITIPAPASQEA